MDRFLERHRLRLRPISSLASGTAVLGAARVTEEMVLRNSKRLVMSFDQCL